MKIKRKISVFSLILQGDIESRFPEIQSIHFLDKHKVELNIHSEAAIADFDQFFWPYIHHLAEEFGEPACHYHIELKQDRRLISGMKYRKETIPRSVC